MRVALSWLCALAVLHPLARAECLRSADHRTINALFTAGGPKTRIVLCPSTEYRLSGTIVFTAADQEISTEGYPTDDRRAVLRIKSERIATAVQGDCRRCARVALRSLIIDGGRKQLGRVQDSNNAPGLIVLGGNEGQAVRDCAIYDPRGFTAIHVREGAKLNCKGAVIEGNTIGPVGEEYNPDVDGPDPESSPLGRPLADGISIACRDSVVRHNVITDCTDAGIVVYCSPGSEISGNRITTSRRSAIGGIMLADAEPFDGDYSGMVVKDNLLHASGRAMRVAIGIGLSILSDDIDTILKGGSVIGNHLQGKHMGYGIAAAGIDGWTIKDNWSDARYEGKPSPRCFDDTELPDPTAFLYHKATIGKSTVQDGFVDFDFAYIACLDEIAPSARDYREQAALPPPVVATEPETTEQDPDTETPKDVSESAGEAAVEDKKTVSSTVDGILQYSQQRMLRAIEELGELVPPAQLADLTSASDFGLSSETLDDLEARLNTLESSQGALLSSVRSFRRSIKRLATQALEHSVWEADALEDIKRDLGWKEETGTPQGVQWGVFVMVLGMLGVAAAGYQRLARRRAKSEKLV